MRSTFSSRGMTGWIFSSRGMMRFDLSFGRHRLRVAAPAAASCGSRSFEDGRKPRRERLVGQVEA